MRWLVLLIPLFTVGCPLEQGPPGELIGKFNFTAFALPSDCQLADVPDGGFDFSATFSHLRDEGQAWMTVGGVVRDAGFDGTQITSVFSAPRRFIECDCADRTDVEETLRVMLISASQDQAIADAGCPLNPFDGGVPEPNPDAGIEGPRHIENGFDAIRACGELVDLVVPQEGAGCKCEACSLNYRLEGTRE